MQRLVVNKLLSLASNPLVKPSLWALIGLASSQLIRLVSNLILTRLLSPQDFGLMAIVLVVVAGMEMFSDLGVNTILIQNKRGSEQSFINTAWTVQIFRGLAIALVLFATSEAISNFYNEPQLSPIIKVIGVFVFVSSLASTALYVGMREMWLGKFTVLTLVSQITAMIASIIYAYQSPSAWALVVAFGVNALMTAMISHLVFPQWRVRLEIQLKVIKEILSFGKWILLTSVVLFAAGQIDKIVLPKMVSLETVGFYSLASLWASLPNLAFQTWVSKVLFPFASNSLMDDAKGSRARLIVSRRHSLILCLGSTAVFGAFFTPFFQLIYPPEYWPSINFFLILLSGSAIRIVDESYRVFNLAAGKPHYTAIGSTISLLCFCLLLFPLYKLLGEYGLALAYSISQAGTLTVAMFGAHRLQLTDLGFDAVVVLGSLLLFATANILI